MISSILLILEVPDIATFTVISLNSINWLFFVMEMQYVYCEAGAEVLCII
jgi:hypothetical protein